MAVREILLLGDPRLYEVAAPVLPDELPALQPVLDDLLDTLRDFRTRTGFGRAIAAPQIGVAKRIVMLESGDRQTAFLNPEIDQHSPEMLTLWDDCMSFPGLEVRLQRHRSCRIRWRDERWAEHTESLDGDLSELLQHECDHLDGVLATQRALDDQSLRLVR